MALHPDDIPVPSEEQLAEFDREVCFVPVDNERPKALVLNRSASIIL